MKTQTRMFVAVCFVVLCSAVSWAGQPAGIVLNPNGVSYIYPVLDTTDWVLTQPQAGRMSLVPDSARVTHWGDEYYAQDWARGCGSTHGHRLYAGISGQVVLASNRGPYGYTVVVYDSQTGFALKYSHLSEILVNAGEYVLAGKSLVGRVGNTGNVQSAGCGSHAGAHLHLALFRNVANPSVRPVTSTSASHGSHPTLYAAQFGYTAGVHLVKEQNNSTVFVLDRGVLTPVSAVSFASHGWWFDRYQSVFNPLAGRVVANGALQYIPRSSSFWPPRDYTLVRAPDSATVYQFEDGRLHALVYNVFMCRALRFNEVMGLSAGERGRYLPGRDIASDTCGSGVRQALTDWQRYAQVTGLFSTPELSGYAYHPDWDPNWHLRSLPFRHNSGRMGTVYLATHVRDLRNRMVAYDHPQTGAWSGWQHIP